jgi:hypothetical protein
MHVQGFTTHEIPARPTVFPVVLRTTSKNLAVILLRYTKSYHRHVIKSIMHEGTIRPSLKTVIE